MALPAGQIAHDLVVPHLPAGKLSDILLLIIGIVGTTVAPWQLFFQQSYVIDKRITPHFMGYEKADLWLGILVVLLGAIAMIVFCAATFAGRPEFGNFTDAGGVAAGLARYAGPAMATLFAIALIDAAIIGASAVSLATAYAIGDVLALKHSLHRKASDARGFYAVYAGLIAASAVLVQIPGAPLGLITLAVQTLAGVLLPSATVFLLLLCNDAQVLGPWVNGKWLNRFTGLVVGVLVLLSVVLTASVLYPDISGRQILSILAAGSVLLLLGAAGAALLRRQHPAEQAPLPMTGVQRRGWRMPPVDTLAPASLTLSRRVWMGVLRLYLVAAAGMVVTRIVQLALSQS